MNMKRARIRSIYAKIAVLKYYSTRVQSADKKDVKEIPSGIVWKTDLFSVFLSYEKDWLIELQLWDKTLIEYKGQKDSRVMLYYSLQKGGEESSDYSTEVLTPMYENIYVKKFVCFANEKLKYYFKETIDGNSYRSDKELCVRETVEKGEPGRYGRLNDILIEKNERAQEKNSGICSWKMRLQHIFSKRTVLKEEVVFSWDREVSSDMR